jgi:hypothetical protein
MNTPTPETDAATPDSQQSISEEAAAIVAGERIFCSHCKSVERLHRLYH